SVLSPLNIPHHVRVRSDLPDTAVSAPAFPTNRRNRTPAWLISTHPHGEGRGGDAVTRLLIGVGVAEGLGMLGPAPAEADDYFGVEITPSAWTSIDEAGAIEGALTFSPPFDCHRSGTYAFSGSLSFPSG